MFKDTVNGSLSRWLMATVVVAAVACCGYLFFSSAPHAKACTTNADCATSCQEDGQITCMGGSTFDHTEQLGGGMCIDVYNCSNCAYEGKMVTSYMCYNGSCSIVTNNMICNAGSAGSCQMYSGGSYICSPPSITCTSDGDCSGAGVCQVNHCNLPGTTSSYCSTPTAPAGTACTTDNNSCTNDVCDSFGSCTHPAVSGTHLSCSSNSCSAVANTTTACTNDNYCSGKSAGSACNCVANYGQACGGSDCVNAGTVSCTGSCVGTSNKANGASCTSDNNSCTSDVCNGSGTCTHNAVSGNHLSCASNSCSSIANTTTSCTDDGYCSGKSSGAACNCVANYGASCGGTDCINAGTISCTGTCVGTSNKAAGFACTSDGNSCTTDACNGSGTCSHNVISGSHLSCSSNACSSSPNTAAACADDSYCSGKSSGAACNCVANYGASCGGTDCINAGTVSCTGACVGTSNKSSGASCNPDGNSCTSDVCDGSGTCTHPVVSGNHLSCVSNSCSSVGNTTGACTDDSYCSGKSTGSACNCAANYGQACGGSDCVNAGTYACNGTTCNGTSNKPDGTICPTGVCQNGTCNPVTCSKDSDCSGASVCQTNKCNNAGTPSSYCATPNKASGTSCTNDNNSCTSDVCDASGNCTHPAISGNHLSCASNSCSSVANTTTACTDDGYCSGKSAGSACNCVANYGQACGGTDCINAGTISCTGTCVGTSNKSSGTGCTSDGNSCTTDACDGSGACTHSTIGGSHLVCQSNSCTVVTNTSTVCTDDSSCSGKTSGTVCGCAANYGQACGGSDCVNAGSYACDGTTCNGTSNKPDGTICPTGACSNGTCKPVACSQDSDCSGASVCQDNKCGNPGTVTSYCYAANKSTGTACTPDGNNCTDDICDAGVCTHPAVSGTHKACSGTTCQPTTNSATACTDSCANNASCGGSSCPTATGSVSLTNSTIPQIGQSVSASAPSGWTGGTFSSSNSSIASVSQTGNTALVTGNGPGSATISGSGWTAPNGEYNCSLTGASVTVNSPTLGCGDACDNSIGLTCPPGILFCNVSTHKCDDGYNCSGPPPSACSSDAQCNDANACTNDVCLNPGTPSAVCTNPVIAGTHKACSGTTCSAIANTSSACTDSCTDNASCGGGGGSCPSGSVTLGTNNQNIGYMTRVSAPPGWTGGGFSSSNNTIASVFGDSSTGVYYISAYNAGTVTVSGSGWTAPNGATNCNLSGATYTVNGGSEGGKCPSVACSYNQPVTHYSVSDCYECARTYRNSCTIALCFGSGPTFDAAPFDCQVYRDRDCDCPAVPGADRVYCGVSNACVCEFPSEPPPPPPPPPSAPASVSTTNSTCSQVSVSWSAVSAASSYNLYRSTNSTKPASPYKTNLYGTSYQDVNLASGFYYYWVSAVNSSGESAATADNSHPIAATACQANLSDSDKDIAGVNNITFTSPARGACNGFQAVPTDANFTVGDVIHFTINICNDTGQATATSVTITDKLTNLQQPPAGWNAKLDGVAISPTVTGASPFFNSTLTFTVGTVKASLIRTLTFDAAIAIPAGYGSSYGRFQNNATIDYIKDGSAWATPAKVSTPLLIFSTQNNYPGRIEVSP